MPRDQKNSLANFSVPWTMGGVIFSPRPIFSHVLSDPYLKTVIGDGELWTVVCGLFEAVHRSPFDFFTD
jgi:hypothetical protein